MIEHIILKVQNIREKSFKDIDHTLSFQKR